MQRVRSLAGRARSAPTSTWLSALRGISGAEDTPSETTAAASSYTQTRINPTSAGSVKNSRFQPSPASLMCKGMSFSVSLFYHNVSLSPSVMASALQRLANEAPILAGRTSTEANRVFPRLDDVTVNVTVTVPTDGGGDTTSTDSGFSFRTETRSQSLRDAIGAIWGNKNPLFLHERRASSHTIEPVSAGKTDADELAQVDLVRYTDGTVLTLHISHLLADAGRAMKLLERLSAIYEAIDADDLVPQATITCDTWYDAQYDAQYDFSTILTHSTSPSASQLLRLRPAHLLELPAALRTYATTKFSPAYVYVPRAAVTSLQACSNNLDDISPQDPISKMDIVQAIAVTLLRRARASHPANSVVINMDLSRMTSSSNDVLGNSSDFLQIQDEFHPTDVVHNARRIRNALAAFKSNARENVQRALHKTLAMSKLPKSAVHAAFIIHGHREKLASCTAVASFPTDAVRFGGAEPSFHSVNSHVGFDWWSIVSSVSPSPISDLDGWVIAMNVPAGTDLLLTQPATYDSRSVLEEDSVLRSIRLL